MSRPRLIQFALAFLLLITACNLPTAAAPTLLPTQAATALPVSPTAPSLPTPLPPTESLPPAPTPSLAPSWTATLSPTAAPVTVSATGNLNVRRGPGVGYNPVGGLLKGETATATARDANGEWLYISLASSKPGWVSILTKFSTVSGDVQSLPVMNVDPPKPAYFRNCTFHPMLVKPAGITVPPQNESPQNKVQFNPGDYEVKDTSVAGEPTVMEATLFEGQTIDIRTDGIPNTYSCP